MAEPRSVGQDAEERTRAVSAELTSVHPAGQIGDAEPTGRVPIGAQLRASCVVAILRAEDAARAEAAVDVLVEAGIRCLELTLTTRGALDVIARLAARLPARAALRDQEVWCQRDQRRAEAEAGEQAAHPQQPHGPDRRDEPVAEQPAAEVRKAREKPRFCGGVQPSRPSLVSRAQDFLGRLLPE
jgi:hypothetical protein